MIVEVNDAGEILIPAELVQAAPKSRLSADREGPLVVFKPLSALTERAGCAATDSLPILVGQFANGSETFRREDIYGPDAPW
jgi:hypothetical protein